MASVAPGGQPASALGGELDPLFVKALRLFHSTSKDSVHQLKAMLDEAIQGRSSGSSRKPSASGVVAPHPPPQPVSNPRDEQRRNFENLKRDLNDLMDVPGASASTKRPKLHGSPGFSKSHTPSPSATPTPPVASTAATGGGAVSGNASSAGDADDVDFGDLEGLNDLTCCVCKDWAQGNGNKLMECHTCQNLYHQECHNPPISDDEAGDPRLVWNCSQCKAPKPKSSSSGSSSGIKSSSSSSSKSSSGSIKRSSSSDKHSSSSSSGLGSSSSSYKSSSSSNSSSSKSKSSSSYSKSSSSSSSGHEADKRLQMLKKKAAQKRK